MSKIFTTLACGLCLLAGAATAQAQTLQDETITSGIPFSLNVGSYTTFTAPSEGVIVLEVNGEFSFKDHLFSAVPEQGILSGWENAVDPNESGATSTGYSYTYNNIEAKTYYVFYGEDYDLEISNFVLTFTADADDDKEYFTADSQFTIGAGETVFYKGAPDTTDFYFQSTSDQNYATDLYFTSVGNYPVEIPLTGVMGTGGYVYTSEDQIGDMQYSLTNNGSESIDLTLVLEKYDPSVQPGPSVEGEEIVPTDPFTVETDHLVWYFTPSQDVTDFYFKVDVFTDNKFTKPEYGPYLAFSQNSDGTNPIQLSYVEGSDDSFYTGSGLNANTTYYIVGLGDFSYDDYTVTLYLNKYEATPSSTPQITVGQMFVVSTDNSVYEFTNSDESSIEFYMISNSNTNLYTTEQLAILAGGWDVFGPTNSNEVTVVPTESGLVYAGIQLGRQTFTFQYSGTETIELTLVRGHYNTGNEESDFLNEADLLKATLNSEYPVVEITWNEKVYLFDDDAVITVKKDNEAFASIPVNSVYVQLIPGGDNEPSIETRADLSDSGEVLNILLGAIDEYTAESGAGTYTLSIPQGVFNTEAGKVNAAQSFTVEVVDYPIGTSLQDGTDFAEGDEVNIMISFEGKVEENPDNENGYVVGVFEGTGLFEATYNVGDDAIELVGEDVMVKLGEELPTGYYQLSIPEGALLIDGAMNGETTINFTVGDPSAINSIGAELNGDEVIYNLNGVKLNKPVKGINIINGKKVVVK